MPIKKDENGNRRVEMELLVPGTPEQVWEAMATGPGNAAWFVRAEIEQKEGGALTLDFGHGMTTSGEVTIWQPPHRFGYVEHEWDEGAPPVATEITITGRSGNQCVVRMVHSLFASTDDWDDQIEGFESGWPGFFAVLRVYLQYFAGQPAASFVAMASVAGETLDTWRRLGEALGFAGANVGERCTLSDGPDAWSGVVERVHQDPIQRFVVLRLDAPSPGIVLAGTNDASSYGSGSGTTLSICRYYYGDDTSVRVEQSEERWRTWIARTFDTDQAEEPS